MMMARGEVAASVKHPIQQLERAVMRAPSRRRVDPGSRRREGEVVLVGARRADDAEHRLLEIALDGARRGDREVLVVVANVRWAEFQAAAILAGITACELPQMTMKQLACLHRARTTLAELPITLVGSVIQPGRTTAVSIWLDAHRNGLAVLPAAWPALAGHDETVAAGFVDTMSAMARTSESTIVMPWPGAVSFRQRAPSL